MLPTQLIYPPACEAHDTSRYYDHPEHPERLRAVLTALARRWPERPLAEPAPASAETLALVHTPAYIATVERLARAGGGLWDADTVISPGSYEAARAVVGGACAAVDAVLAGTPAFALGRPPGHHALDDAAMGFCLFNNIAVAARHAQQAHGVGRVLIVDWDVHHGNGTQASFYTDGTVAYFSLHQYPFYPMTGVLTERGAGAGEGAICNVPLPAGCGDAEYLAVFQQVLVPFATGYRPDLILVSAGYDAHRLDPLGGMRVSSPGFAALTAEIMALADTVSAGRLALVLEGGYSLDALAEGVVTTVATLDGAPAAPGAGRPAPVVQRLIAQARTLHGLD